MKNITAGWIKDRWAGYRRAALPVRGWPAYDFREDWHGSPESPHRGLVCFWLAYHKPLSSKLSFHLELLCTIDYGKLVTKMAPILHPLLNPCPLHGVWKPFPHPRNLNCPCDVLQPRKHRDSESLPVPSPCLHRSWLLPFAVLDLASAGKLSRIGLLEDERPAQQSQGHPRHPAPRYPASGPWTHE